jgi:hypothetical protein
LRAAWVSIDLCSSLARNLIHWDCTVLLPHGVHGARCPWQTAGPRPAWLAVCFQSFFQQ